MDLVAASDESGAVRSNGEELSREIAGIFGETHRQVAAVARHSRRGEVLAQRSARRRVRLVIEVLPEEVSGAVGLLPLARSVRVELQQKRPLAKLPVDGGVATPGAREEVARRRRSG
jgi:hypothetical protein